MSCEGIPATRCDEAVASVARSLPNSPVAGIEVVCVAGTCTEQAGAIDTIVTLVDGSRLRSTHSRYRSGISWRSVFTLIVRAFFPFSSPIVSAM